MDSNCKAKFNLDHVYCHPNDGNFIRTNSGSTEVLTILKENKQLKAMLLLHLDLIQEQSDQLMAKDKLLSSLREENESLKLRLERLDKRLQKNRVSEQKESVPAAASAASVKNEIIPKVKVLNGETSTTTQRSPPSTKANPVPTSSSAEQSVAVKSESKYKICDDSCNTDNNVIGENNGKYITKIVLQRVQSPPGCKSPRIEEDKHSAKATETSYASPTRFSGGSRHKAHLKDEESVFASNSEKGDERDNFSCGSGTEQESVYNKLRRKRPIRYGNLTTKRLYCSREWEDETVDEDLNKEESEALKSENPNLEIPKWTIKEFHGLYTIEGTEDLSDDVFLKRHNKLEIDEKRRKKWDVQRIREQRTIERLKRRHCKEEVVTEPEENESLSSFFPSPDQIKFIQITDEIPVNAFGEIIPRLKAEDFELPWAGSSCTSATSANSSASPSTSAAAASSSTSMLSTGECSTRRSNFSNFGPTTSWTIVKKRRRQYSTTGSISRRSTRKHVMKN